MKKVLFSAVTVLSCTAAYAQTGKVGVNTATPQTTLDVRATNHLGAVTATDGITAPRVNDLATAGTIDGQLVYLTANAGTFSKGFHFWNGSAWTPFDNTNDAFINNAGSTRVELGSTSAGAARAANAAFVVKDDAKTGIGTNNPLNLLHITDGSTSGLSQMYGKGIALTAGGGSTPRIYFENLNAPSGQRTFQIEATSGILRFNALTDDAGATLPAAIYPGIISITPAGTVGIGTNTPNNKLDVAAGNINIENTNTAGSAGIIKMNNTNFMHNYNGVYLGASAGNTSNTGSLNVGVGNNALSAITTATDQVAVGAGALGKTTTGNFNTAVGSAALFNNTTGNNNVAVGTSTMFSNTTGSHNAVLGVFSLNKNTTGIQNTSIGKEALNDNTTGSNNTVVGYLAGEGITTGSNNTIIGSGFTALAGATANNIIIGDGSGNRRINVLANGNIGLNNVNNPLSPIQHSTGATLSTAGVWTNASDKRLKHDIKDSKYGLKDVMKIRAVDYKMNSDNSAQVGLIAQELKTIVPEVVSGKEGDVAKGETLGVSYGNLVPVLINAIKEQQKQIEDLRKEVQILKAK
jgi:Chaperone of endosialidase